MPNPASGIPAPPAPGAAPLDTIETPAAVVDLARARANAERVAGYAAAHGLAWRPHVKTHKSTRIARIQLAAGAQGLTVATPREAEVMATVCSDLLLAYPPVGEERMRRILALPPEVRLSVALDSGDLLATLAQRAVDAGRSVGVLLEMDLGMRRVGVEGVDDLLRLAEQAASLRGVEYRGVLFYPGHIRDGGGGADAAFARLADDLGERLEALRAAGLPARVVSGGSTPTLWRTHEIPGVTEFRSGTVIFHDRETVAAGVGGAEEWAYTILASVVSTAGKGRVVVDAGSKALCREPPRGPSGGFGVLLDPPGLVLAALSEEHGVIDVGDSGWAPRVGDRVRIVPNHVCVSVNLQDELLLLDGGQVERTPIEGRGRGRWVGKGGAGGAE
jgi:D-serine deaminase-like pyridoxal phosphate-dependent protein